MNDAEVWSDIARIQAAAREAESGLTWPQDTQVHVNSADTHDTREAYDYLLHGFPKTCHFVHCDIGLTIRMNASAEWTISTTEDSWTDTITVELFHAAKRLGVDFTIDPEHAMIERVSTYHVNPAPSAVYTGP